MILVAFYLFFRKWIWITVFLNDQRPLDIHRTYKKYPNRRKELSKISRVVPQKLDDIPSSNAGMRIHKALNDDDN